MVKSTIRNAVLAETGLEKISTIIGVNSCIKTRAVAGHYDGTLQLKLI
jgi:hypothetical protein